MAFLLNEQFAPAPDDDAIRRWRELLESGEPMDQQIAAQKLVDLGAEQALLSVLHAKNPVAVQLASNSLWECWRNEQGKEARRIMDQGIAKMESGELEDALEIFVRLSRRHPEWAEAHNKRATVLYLLGNARLSYKVCQLVTELKPEHFGAWNGMALCAASLLPARATLRRLRRPIPRRILKSSP